MPNVNFVSDNKGYAISNNHTGEDGKPKAIMLDGKKIEPGHRIVQFSFYQVVDAVKGFVEKGVLSLDAEKDKERIEFIRKYGDNNKAYREVKNLPQSTFSNGGIVTGALTGANSNPSPQILVKSVVEKTMQYMKLKQNLFKQNGEIRKDVEEAEINEFNELAKELNLV